jgi:hypothetical protein
MYREDHMILIIGLCILLRVYQLNIGITSIRNKTFFGARMNTHITRNSIKIIRNLRVGMPQQDIQEDATG